MEASTAKCSNRLAERACIGVSMLCAAYLLSLGPASVLKTSGALDMIPGGCQTADIYACPGVMLLRVPGFGAAYEAYLRWWDDIDEPG